MSLEVEGDTTLHPWCFRCVWEAENTARAFPGLIGLVPSKNCWYFCSMLGIHTGHHALKGDGIFIPSQGTPDLTSLPAHPTDGSPCPASQGR